MTKILNTKKLTTEIEKLKLTKVEIAKQCGISRVTLDSVLKGKEIGLHKFLKLVDTTGLNVGFFFDEEVIEKKEFHSSGEKAVQADHIDKIDMRDQRNMSESNVQKNKPSYEELELKVADLNDKLIEAQGRIIKLMDERK